MVRELTEIQESERQKSGQDFYTLVEIDFQTVGTKYYADRWLEIGGRIYADYVRGVAGVGGVVAPGVDTWNVCGMVEIEFVDVEEDSNRLSEIMKGELLDGLVVRIGFLFKDFAGSAGLEDIIYYHTYLIDDYEKAGSVFRIKCVDIVLGIGEKKIGRYITEERFPDAPTESYGLLMPIMWGKGLKDCLAIPVAVGKETRLDGSILAEDGVITVDDVSEFPVPAPGEWIKIEIDGERIEYGAVDVENRTFGTVETPCRRGVDGTVAREHQDRAVVREVKASYDFLVADHSVVGVSNVRVDGTPVSDGMFNVVGQVVDGQVVTLLRFTGFPQRRKYEKGSEKLDLRGGELYEGEWEVGSGNTAENASSAIDGRVFTAAKLSRDAQVLQVKNMNDLSEGDDKYGQLRKVRLAVEYAEKPKVTSAVPRIRVKKGTEQIKEVALETPTDEDVGVDAEPHGHSDSFEVDYTRPEAQLTINEFEYVSGADAWVPNGGQVNFWLYHDQYATSGSVYYGFYEEMEYILSVAGYNCDPDVDLYDYLHGNDPTLGYKLKVPSDHPQGAIRRVIFRALVEKSNDEGAKICFHAAGKSQCFTVGEKGWVEWTVPNWTPTWDDLGYITYYISAARVGTGRPQLIREYQFRLYAVEVIIVYEAEMDINLMGGVEQGQISAEVMSSRVVQKVDVTNEVVARGGWGFFDGSGNVVVEVDFAGSADEGVVYVIDVGFEIEYRPVEIETGAGEVTCDVEATDIEYGADVVKNLLTDSRFGGLDEGWLDSDSFAATREKHVENGVKFCRRLDFQTELRTLLAEAAWQGLSRLFFSGQKFYLKWRAGYGFEGEPVMTVDKDVVVSRVGWEWTPRVNVANEIAVYYNRDRKGNGNYNSCLEVRDTLSVAQRWGLIRDTVDATWVARSGDEARALIELIARFLILQRAWKHCVVRMETSLACIHLEVGDWVVVNLPREGLNGVQGEVVGVSRAGTNRLALAVDVLMVAKRPWWWDSGCYIEVTPTYSYMNFWVKGQLAMRLSADGDLEIHSDFLPETIKDAYGTEVVNHDPATHYLHFVFDCGGGEYYEWLQIVILDARYWNVKYNQEVEVWEKQDLSGVVTDYLIKQEGDEVKFAVNGVDVVMVFNYTTKTIKLKGEVRERAFWK